MEGTDDTEPTVTFAVAVRKVPDGDLYAALMSAVPFEIPLITGHIVAVQPLTSSIIKAMLGLLEVHSATIGYRAGIT